jgi:hypothetical protein
MSSVTNIILHYTELTGENGDYNALPTINTFLREQMSYKKGLVAVGDSQLPKYWYGGGRALECDLTIGAFNYFDVERFVEYLKTLPWCTRHNCVQLLYMEQEQAWFRSVMIHEVEE